MINKSKPRRNNNNKRNAFPTALTQNVEYLLDSVLASTMLSNSELIVMLNQAASDRADLARLLNISDEQLSYITNASAGSGLIRYGSSLVPFVNNFPKGTELYKLMTTKPTEESAWPVPGYAANTSSYGMRRHPITGKYKMHTGTDLAAPLGTKIVAAEAGKVVSAGWGGGYGNFTIIDHGNGLSTRYAHQSRIMVKSGNIVKRGQVIGLVGSTGMSTGPHLHFEVQVNGEFDDPMTYIKEK